LAGKDPGSAINYSIVLVCSVLALDWLNCAIRYSTEKHL
jgi:hypothetical protein